MIMMSALCPHNKKIKKYIKGNKNDDQDDDNGDHDDNDVSGRADRVGCPHNQHFLPLFPPPGPLRIFVVAVVFILILIIRI